MLADIRVGLRHDPGWGVRDSEIEDFPCGDEVVEGLHHLLDAGGEVEVVHVELRESLSLALRRSTDPGWKHRPCNVTIARSQLPLAGFKARKETLARIFAVIAQLNALLAG